MPETEEEKTLVWESITQICSVQILCCRNGDKEDRGIKALPTINGISKEDRMKFDGEGEASTSLR